MMLCENKHYVRACNMFKSVPRQTHFHDFAHAEFFFDIFAEPKMSKNHRFLSN